MFIEMFPTFFFVVPPFKENPKVGPHGTHFAPHDSRFARVFRLDWLSHGPLQLTSEHLSCSCWRLTMLTWRKWVRCAIPPDVWGVCLIHPQLYHFCGIVFFLKVTFNGKTSWFCLHVFFFPWVFEVSVLQHSFPPEKKRPNKRRSEAFEASLGDQATGGAEGGMFGDGILKKRGWCELFDLFWGGGESSLLR